MTCLAIGLATFAMANAAPSLAYEPGVALVPETGGAITLSYVAGPEANNVAVDLVSPNYVLTDSGVTTFTDADGAAGCTVAGNQATCPQAGVTKIRIALGDGDDMVVVNAPTPAEVIARGGGTDTVTCATGDTVAADVADQVTGCLADRPPETALVQGPPARTADATPDFAFSSTEEPNVTFECSLDGGPFLACSSPFTSPTLADGSHSFQVRASDAFGPGPPTPLSTFEVDTTAPDTAIDSGPPSSSDSTEATFHFSSPAPTDAVRFECKLDGSEWHACSSPATYHGLSTTAHVFRVRAVDDLGNFDPTEAFVNFTVTSTPVGASGLPPGLVIVRPPASFVLIAGRTIKVSRKRIATVTLNCSGNRDCAGELSLTTAKRIKLSRKRRRYVRLGAATFFIPAPRSLTIKIPLTKRAFRIVRKRKRIKTMITVTDKDRVGRTRISTREVFLKARK